MYINFSCIPHAYKKKVQAVQLLGEMTFGDSYQQQSVAIFGTLSFAVCTNSRRNTEMVCQKGLFPDGCCAKQRVKHDDKNKLNTFHLPSDEGKIETLTEGFGVLHSCQLYTRAED